MASRKAFSLLLSSDVLSTTPPVPLIASKTLSPVIFLTSTNSAASPGCRLAASSFMKAVVDAEIAQRAAECARGSA